jgi:hypothetical protein
MIDGNKNYEQQSINFDWSFHSHYLDNKAGCITQPASALKSKGRHVKTTTKCCMRTSRFWVYEHKTNDNGKQSNSDPQKNVL